MLRKFIHTALFIMLGIIPLVSCVKKTGQTVIRPSSTSPATTDTSKPIRYLALGDSYTIGQSVNEEDRFPVQLSRRMRDNGFPLSDPKIIAVTGWTSSDLLMAVNQAGLSNDYDLITLCIGVNNQYQGWPIEPYKADLTKILQKCLSLTNNRNTRIVVLSIPDYSVTPFARYSDTMSISRDIDRFNQAYRQVAEQFSVPFINITDISRLARDRPEYIASDGLHFSGKMYALWLDPLCDALRNLLK